MSQALSIKQASDGEVIGYLLLSLPGDWERLGNLEQQFLGRMQQILLVGAAVAVGGGLAIGAILSRRLTAPLQRLAVAARAVAAGDLNQWVKGEGSAEMIEVAQAFNEMTRALYESEEQRRNLVADVAHELRSPLTVVQGNLRAILDDVYPLDKDEISRLYDETRLLSRLVDDLRELALADAGQLRLDLHPTNIAGIIQHAVASFGPAAESKGVALTGHYPEHLSAVWVDADRVAQILRNLLLNALRHTPVGGMVTVSARQTESAVQVSVTDSGEGIDPKDLPHVFERFWRADPARTRIGGEMQRSGTGLGLSVAQSLVEAMRGRMWAESRPGEGSTFWFSLPLAAG
jgi:two-component system OmpR family sensor kinase/two-component system sensor histidine kinase BaeS